MKLSEKTFWGLGLILFILMGMGCCESCDKPNLGALAIQLDSKAIINQISGLETVVFAGSGVNELTMTYGFPTSVLIESVIDCDQEGQCGLCCIGLSEEIASTELTSTNGSIQFNINTVYIRKNLKEKAFSLHHGF